MDKKELIDFLCEYLEKIRVARNKSLEIILGDNYHLESDLKKVVNNPSEIVNLDLEALENSFNIDDDLRQKFEAFKLFASTTSFKLNKDQEIDLQKSIYRYLDILLRKNDEKLLLYPEIAQLDDEEDRVSLVLNKMLKTTDYISLDEYMDMVKILRNVQSMYAKDLLRRLSNYMNMVIISQKKNQRDYYGDINFRK